jgi:hypothetical protein
VTHRILLASPVEPSGASWLINCFLELGLKVDHQPVVGNVWRHLDPAPPSAHMWTREPDGRYRLHPKAQVLKKWLPVLSRREAFAFREDVEVEYVQDLPPARPSGPVVLLFVRDPRDSLYSMYCRMRPQMDYEAFLRFPDPDTLLDRPGHWRYFVEGWLARAGDNWFTFEQYKRDAAALIRRIVERAQVPCEAGALERAVSESSYEKARAAEERYRVEFPGDWEVANRAGRVGDWRQRTDARTGTAFVESRAAPTMRRLGYDCPAPTRERDPSGDEALALASTLDEPLLRRTNLPNHRIRRLLDTLAARSRDPEAGPRLRELRQRFEEGSEHQFAQMRDLLVRRRRAKPPGT